MAFTPTQQSELRRFMGYPDLGAPVGNPMLATMASAFRFLDPVGYFETRIQTLSQDAEVQVYGQESAFWALYVPPVVPPGIVWTDPRTNTTYNGYIPTLRVLEGDIPNIRLYRAYTKAKVDFNASEPMDRIGLYNYFRQQLATLLAMPLDPDIIPRSRRRSFRFR